MVPQKATFEVQGKKFVYIVESTGTVRSSEITVLNNDNGQYFVAQSGVRPGEKIVLEGVASLKEGSAIKARPVNTDSVYQVVLAKKE